MTSILIIDANQFLRLYGVAEPGNKLLELLIAQRDRIFVTEQIADEVLRNKLKLARDFFRELFKDQRAVKVAIPDHLLGVDDARIKELRRAFQNAEEARKAIEGLTTDVLSQISRSEDKVSRTLDALFERAAKATEEEYRRAQQRRERGNPPGKPSDPLGDQLTWEQLLTKCRDAKALVVWIITDDEDFLIKTGGQRIINPRLRRDLVEACGPDVQINCYGDLLTGLVEFGKNVGVLAEALPTEEEARQIREQIDVWDANTVSKSAISTILSPENSATTSCSPSRERQLKSRTARRADELYVQGALNILSSTGSSPRSHGPSRLKPWLALPVTMAYRYWGVAYAEGGPYGATLLLPRKRQLGGMGTREPAAIRSR